MVPAPSLGMRPSGREKLCALLKENAQGLGSLRGRKDERTRSGPHDGVEASDGHATPIDRRLRPT